MNTNLHELKEILRDEFQKVNRDNLSSVEYMKGYNDAYMKFQNSINEFERRSKFMCSVCYNIYPNKNNDKCKFCDGVLVSYFEERQ